MNKLSNIIAALRHSNFSIAVILLCVLSMVILPLPPFVLDGLFTFNIVLSIVVLLVSINTDRPLKFSLFPTCLLILTLMRLCLNVASTRVVLLHGNEGVDAAGEVIESFGQVVIGGNFIVGFVVFTILMIANFIVVTKGAERVSEVCARFTLDAMPGKQMAIDADLNAGIITKEQAQERRKEITSESDFYGAMDGASRFVRGDAIAGILILLINVIGGICIGVFSHDMLFKDAAQHYLLLAIGDGLVAQIPSLLLSTATAIIVTRVNDEGDLGLTFRQQLLSNPNILYTASGIMLFLGCIPGMPHLAFIIFAALLAFVARNQSKYQSQVTSKLQEEKQVKEAIENVSQPVSSINWDSIPSVEPLSVTLGYKLISLLKGTKKRSLRKSLAGVRQLISEQFGILVPEIGIRESFTLSPEEYSMMVYNVESLRGRVRTEKLMAIPNKDIYEEIEGERDVDPAYGMTVVWIEPHDRNRAVSLGYQVVESSGVIATHLNKEIRSHLGRIFSYEDMIKLHERLKRQSARLAEDLENSLPWSKLLPIYKKLLEEQISLSDITTIASALLEVSVKNPDNKDTIFFVDSVRYALRESLISSFVKDNQLSVATLGSQIEKQVSNIAEQPDNSHPFSDEKMLPPGLLDALQNNLPIIKEQMKAQGHAPLLLVPPAARSTIARCARLFASGLQVFSYHEVPDHIKLNIVSTLQN